MRWTQWTVVLSVCFTACGEHTVNRNSQGPQGDRPQKPIGELPVNYQTLREQILETRCLSCHSVGSPSLASEFPFETYQLLRSADPPLWAPPGPRSRVVRALQKTDRFRMPPSGEPLSEDEVNFITTWIDSDRPEF